MAKIMDPDPRQAEPAERTVETAPNPIRSQPIEDPVDTSGTLGQSAEIRMEPVGDIDDAACVRSFDPRYAKALRRRIIVVREQFQQLADAYSCAEQDLDSGLGEVVERFERVTEHLSLVGPERAKLARLLRHADAGGAFGTPRLAEHESDGAKNVSHGFGTQLSLPGFDQSSADVAGGDVPAADPADSGVNQVEPSLVAADGDGLGERPREGDESSVSERDVAQMHGDSPSDEGLSSPRAVPGGYLFGGRVVKFDYGAIIRRLGKEPDAQLARELGCSRSQITHTRRSLGVEPFSLSRAYRRLLGKVPDARIARAYGVHRITVHRHRKALGIPRASVKQANDQSRLRAYLEALED